MAPEQGEGEKYDRSRPSDHANMATALVSKSRYDSYRRMTQHFVRDSGMRRTINFVGNEILDHNSTLRTSVAEIL